MKFLYWYTMRPNQKPRWLQEVATYLFHYKVHSTPGPGNELDVLAHSLSVLIANMKHLRSKVEVRPIKGENGTTAVHIYRNELPILIIKCTNMFNSQKQKDMKKFINLTPHSIVLNNGAEIPASGNVARVSVDFTEFDADSICRHQYGEVVGLPEPQDGVCYIVSALVLAATGRKDVVAPATGHPRCKRNEKGLIVSVPGFVAN